MCCGRWLYWFGSGLCWRSNWGCAGCWRSRRSGRDRSSGNTGCWRRRWLGRRWSCCLLGLNNSLRSHWLRRNGLIRYCGRRNGLWSGNGSVCCLDRLIQHGSSRRRRGRSVWGCLDGNWRSGCGYWRGSRRGLKVDCGSCVIGERSSLEFILLDVVGGV